MSTHRKVYRFRMRPTPKQEQELNRTAGARRWVWNWGLARCKEYYEANGKSIGQSQLSAELTAIKKNPETAWLREIDAQVLQQSLADLARAFANFFAKRARYPRFKSRKTDPLRFRTPQAAKVIDGKVQIPKIGKIRIRQSQPVEEKTKSATFRRTADGKWFVSIVAEFEIPDVALPAPDPARVVGVDLGLKTFAVITGGDDIPNPRFFRKKQKKLRKAQRVLSRRKLGSKRRAKAKIRVAKTHQKISNQRADFLHKLTTKLVRENGGICIEDLSLKGLARTKLAKSFSDASMGEFRRQLTYKSEWNRKHLVVIDRFFPSSRLCRGCGVVNSGLTLADREWTCPCGMFHDRDESAAINIRDEGLRILAAGHARQVKRSGSQCKTLSGAVGVEPRIPCL